MPTRTRDPWRRAAAAALTLALLVACGAPVAPDPDPDPDPDPTPSNPTVAQLGTGFAVAPAGVAFDADYAVAAPSGGGTVACTLTLDGEPLATVDPCTTGAVELGPFAAGTTAELTLVATTADGGEASAAWSFTAATWAPFQRLEMGAAVRALAGSDDLLAVLTDADADALAVLRRPNAAIPAGTWAPAEAAVEDVLPRAGGHAIAWYRDQLAWLGALDDGYAPVDVFTGDAESGWGPFRVLGISWAGSFVGTPSFAMSNDVIVVGDGATGDGRWRARNTRSFVDLDETSDIEFVVEPPGPGERAGTAVAALDDVVLVGGPGYTFPGAEAFSPNGRVQAVATADGVEPRAGGFSSGPGSRIGEHLAVVWTPTPAVFMGGAFEVQWAQVRVRPGGDDGSDETVLEALGDLQLADARWIAVNVPPSRGGGDTIAAALLAVGLPDDTVALYFVPLAEGFDPTPLGTLDATGATGPGAWVGNALALPHGDAVVLYDLSEPPVD